MQVFVNIKRGRFFYAIISKDFEKQYQEKIKWNWILKSHTLTLTQEEFEKHKKEIKEI